MFAIPRLRLNPIFEIAQQADASELFRHGNRRRFIVFLLAFSLTLLPGLTWNLLRPGEYRSTARMQISPGSVTTHVDSAAPGASATSDAEPPAPRPDMLSQVQILTSRSLLEDVARRLGGQEAAHAKLPAAADAVVAELQDSVSATPIGGTDVVELQAVGASPQRLARMLNALMDAYRAQLLSTHGSDSRDAVANARDEADRLDKAITAKRAQLAAFQLQTGVVSSERSENETLASIKGLSESLNKANEEAAKAAGRVRSLREAAVAGSSPVYSKDNPTLAAIEKRISETREDLRDMQRTYTNEFLAMDPTAQALRARLAELEQQLATTTKSGQKADLAAAEEDLADKSATVERLQRQIDEQRRDARGFSVKFHEAQAMEDDLTRLEGARRNALERTAKLEASEMGRMPAVKVLETASVPPRPWRPDYLRDGLLNLLASFLFGLLAMWFVELFNRMPAPAGAPTLGLSHAWMEPSMTVDASLAAPARLPELAHKSMPQLPDRMTLPRELTQDEVGALLSGADGDGRLLCGILLLGLTVEELKALTVGDADLARARLRVSGTSARTLALPDWLAQALAAPAAALPEQPLFRNPLGQALGDAEIGAGIACAALDAGLDGAATVTPEVLRHSCIANLVRQNVRFSNLATLVGQLSAGELTAYASLADGGRRTAAEAVDPIMPALRAFQAAG